MTAARAEPILAMDCTFPDSVHPDGYHVVDWGTVRRSEEVAFTDLAGNPTRGWLYEIVGQRRRYVIDGSNLIDAVLVAHVGDTVLLCPDDDIPLRAAPASWGAALTVVRTAARIAAPPTLPAGASALRSVTKIGTVVRRGAVDLPAGVTALLRAEVRAVLDDTHVRMRGDWVLELPVGTPGAALALPGRSLWIAGVAAEVPATDDHGAAVPTLRATRLTASIVADP